MSGLWLAARGGTGDGRCSKSKRIGVKEMLTDAVNVICLLPQEVDSSLYCLEAEDAEGPYSQVEKVLYNFKQGFPSTSFTKALNCALIPANISP